MTPKLIVDFGWYAKDLTVYGRPLSRYMIFIGGDLPSGVTEYADTVVTYNPNNKAVWLKKPGNFVASHFELTEEENKELLLQIMKSEIWRRPS